MSFAEAPRDSVISRHSTLNKQVHRKTRCKQVSEKVFTFAESIGSVGHVPDHVRLIGKTDVSTERERESVRRFGEKKENFGELTLVRVF